MKIFSMSFTALFITGALFLSGCGKTENQTSSTDEKSDKQTEKQEVQEEQKTGSQTLEVSGNDKAVEIHTSGMTCTACEKTIKTKVKKVDGVKDVIADFNTGLVKASYDPGKTNPKAIEEAISSAGYTVVHAH